LVEGYTVSEYITDASGEILIENLDAAIYQAEEFMAPDGYIRYDELKQIRLEAGKTSVLKFDNICTARDRRFYSACILHCHDSAMTRPFLLARSKNNHMADMGAYSLRKNERLFYISGHIAPLHKPSADTGTGG
jgi:uncharacterized surface anchored protein